MRVITAIIISVVAAATACAEPRLPPMVQASIDETLKGCSKPKFEKGFVTRKDINGDGATDYILDHGYLSCDGAHNDCGSGGCTVEMFASLEGGEYSKAFTGLVQNYKFLKSDGYPAVYFTLHGLYCGKTGADVCHSTLYWNGSEFTPAH